MPKELSGEFYFIFVAMVLIMIGGVFGVYAFVKLYRKEMAQKDEINAKALAMKKARDEAMAKAKESETAGAEENAAS
jgi:hypothetical protein